MVQRSVSNVSDNNIARHIAKSQSEKVRALLWSFVDTPTLLLSIGISSAFISFAVTKIASIGDIVRIYCTSSRTHEGWVMYTLVCMLLAVLSCFVTQTICPEAVGGGLSDMKVILSGTIKPVKLSKRLIVAKIVGLAFALAAGLSVGKEGPVVHMSGAVAEQLMTCSPFKTIHANYMKRIEILACACAAGVSATFGAAYGGVLFSIEVTCAAYMVRNLPRAYLCSICCMLVFLGLGVTNQIALFSAAPSTTPVTQKPTEGFHFSDIGIFALFGAGFGLVGVVFVAGVQIVSKWRNVYLDPYLPSAVVSRRMYAMVITVAAMSAPLMYLEQEFRSSVGNPQQSLTENIFSTVPIDNIFHKLYFFPVKFLITIFCVTLPLPVGLFTPVFLLGGVLGRIIGEAVAGTTLAAGYSAREIALIGAAALSTGVTRAISTVVIVYELFGQPHLRLPLSVAIITAYFIGNRFTKGIYDILIEQSGSPFLPSVPKDLAAVYVSDVMQPVTAENVLTLSSTYADAISLINRYDTLATTAATTHVQDFHITTSAAIVVVVVSVESMVIVGAVDIEDLRSSLYDNEKLLFPLDKLHNTITYVTSKTRGVCYEAALSEEHPGWCWKIIRASRRNATVDIRDDFNLPHSTTLPLTKSQELSETTPLKASPLPPISPFQRIRSLTFGSLPRSVGPLPQIVVDPSPYQASEVMHLDKVELLIRMLRLHQVLVTQSGRLVGIVTRDTLKKYIGSREKQPIDKLVLLLTSLQRVGKEFYEWCGGRYSYDTIDEDL